MESLRALMGLIDANSEKIPEGDYLAMCGAMKDVHANVKLSTIKVPSVDYYVLEEELYRVCEELSRLHKKRDNIHYRKKMTKRMKSEAIEVYAFGNRLDSLREYSVEAVRAAGIDINFGEMFTSYLNTFNDDVYERKKVIHTQIEEARVYRDATVRRMAAGI